MRAVLVQGDKLIWADTPTPTLQAGEVLIANKATAINRADLMQRAGGYQPPPGASDILGLECAGVVAAIGEGVSRYKKGDLVCALLAGGGYAEQVAVPAGQVLPIPKGFDFVQAAALPEVFATAWLNLFMEAGVKSANKALLHAGASGVGTAAIQLCKAFDVDAFVTVGSDEKLAACLELGAVAGVNRQLEAFAARADQWTARAGFDVILDPVGGDYLQDNLACLAVDGRLVIIGLMGGATAELSLARLMMKRQRIIGSTLRARSVAAKAMVMDELLGRVWPLLEQGTIKPVIQAVMAIQEAEQAQQLLASNQTVGKVVLTIEA